MKSIKSRAVLHRLL